MKRLLVVTSWRADGLSLGGWRCAWPDASPNSEVPQQGVTALTVRLELADLDTADKTVRLFCRVDHLLE